ncbi:uncharacterized protein LOC111401263 isoform X2 [Olea europaea var. sylvestris]|uniref:uncharacterized protein LOC111401263 isoform X2 n=1 Tax=Olea europaea var. sylvestris TaxID=158386 RepID=UPI000C1D2A22|nr:uncharacterized protein LOC111401263 isoform X2 [Olea europaea var. sylvestris]
MNKIKACSQTVTSPSQHSLKDDGVARVLGPELQGRPRDGSLNGSNNLQNRKCKLLSWFEKADVVAKGEIASTNLSDLVHHVPLGNECWRVWVNEVIDNVSLYRPTRELFLLEDALGSTIEWPIRYIEVDSL